jgi:hypothetical protein
MAKELTYHQKLAADRKAAGLCVKCGKESGEGKSVGPICAAKNEATRAKAVKKRKSAGICQYSGCGQPAMPGRTVCKTCSQKYSDITKAKYHANRAAGVCPYCGEEKPADVFACPLCTVKQAAHKLNWYNERKAKGICTQCNKAPATPGFIHCPDCRKTVTARVLAAHHDARRLAIETYGAACELCPETELAVLQIDHVSGHGNQHRAEIGQATIFRWLAREGFPDGFRVLCSSCNKREHLTKSGKGRHAEILDVMNAYGGPVCVGCPCDDIRVLEIDHIDGDGHKHRKEVVGTQLYRWLRRNKFPSGYRVLCPNCNHRARMGIPFPNETELSTVTQSH